MDDLISREDAQRITGEMLSGWLTDAERKVLEKVEAELGELPSVGKAESAITIELKPEQIKKYVEQAITDIVPSEQQWIPCSEMLPMDKGVYLVTDDSGGVAWVEKAWFMWCDDGSPFWEYANVTAWMRLPTPYKGGEKCD